MCAFKIGIVVLNWNNYVSTRRIVNQLLEQIVSCSFLFKIYIVDNYSSFICRENLIDMCNSDNRLEYIQTGSNLGYTGGNNAGLVRSIKEGNKYHFVLNNDLELKKFDIIIEKVIGFFAINPMVGIIGIDYISPEGHFNNKRLMFKLLNFLLLEIKREERIADFSYVYTVCGCSIAFRDLCLEDVGLFDEKLFMYSEEHDICLRAASMGWNIVNYQYDASLCSVNRKVEDITKRPVYWYYDTRNIYIVYKKNLRGLKKTIAISMQLIVHVSVILRQLFSGRFVIVKKMTLGLVHGLINLKGRIG